MIGQKQLIHVIQEKDFVKKKIMTERHELIHALRQSISENTSKF